MADKSRRGHQHHSRGGGRGSGPQRTRGKPNKGLEAAASRPKPVMLEQANWFIKLWPNDGLSRTDAGGLWSLIVRSVRGHREQLSVALLSGRQPEIEVYWTGAIRAVVPQIRQFAAVSGPIPVPPPES
jgi:hypothetical protein